jgi:hypothetical protein
MFRQLKDAGMLFAAFGIQSGSKRILDLYNRRYSLETLLETVQMAVDEGLKVCYDFLSNNPFENEEDLKETLKFILKLPKPDGYILFHLRLFQNLALNECQEKRYDLPENVFTFWNYLYFIALERLLPDEDIFKLMIDENLKQNPQKLIEMTIELKRKKCGKVPLFDEPEKHFKPPQLQQTPQSLSHPSILSRIKQKIKKSLKIQ